jgi:hypothetical protein
VGGSSWEKQLILFPLWFSGIGLLGRVVGATISKSSEGRNNKRNGFPAALYLEHFLTYFNLWTGSSSKLIFKNSVPTAKETQQFSITKSTD